MATVSAAVVGPQRAAGSYSERRPRRGSKNSSVAHKFAWVLTRRLSEVQATLTLEDVRGWISNRGNA